MNPHLGSGLGLGSGFGLGLRLGLGLGSGLGLISVRGSTISYKMKYLPTSLCHSAVAMQAQPPSPQMSH